MNTRGTGIWVGLAMAVPLSLAVGCAAVKAPILAVDSLKLGNMGITGVTVDVAFRVRNPNPEPMKVDRFEYELFVNGNRLGRGFESKGFDLPGFGEETVRSRFDVNLLGLPGAVKEVLQEDRVKARAKGRFYASGEFGRKELGFDSDAEVGLGRR
jgi:LEA14-like dessication related protein